MSSEKKFSRLPRSLKPVSYKLNFVPFLRESIFFGEASIVFKVLERTNIVKLNSKKIEILSAQCKLGLPETIEYDADQELVTLTFEAPIQEGQFVLDLKFKGVISDSIEGLYRSTAKNSDGKDEIILCTHFEPTYARKAFPCMDEPDRKATFEISMVVLDHLVALSNMPEISRNIVETPESLPPPTNNRQYVKVQFAVSPIMSTYLVAMVIGRFDHESVTDVNGVQIRVFTPVGKAYLASHALRISKSALPFYADIFGVGYPLLKLDLVAIPDFNMGAMENWGLITYRETALLIDSHKSSLRSKRNVALTVAHELSHMWFGNLVTMDWWTHLWLKEGFATWMEYLAVDHCFPEYDIWTIFLSAEFYSAMTVDELKTSHPIEAPVSSPSEIEEIFDAVSYEKGASIIRMLHEYIGNENFIKGLQLYMNKHKYGNTVTEDLWNAFSEVVNEPISEIMSTWTKQTGFPVLNVRAVEHHDDRAYMLAIEQSRFLADGSAGGNNSEWYVPITICDVNDSSKVIMRTVIPPRSVTKDAPAMITIPCSDGKKPKIRVNPGTVGYFRVNYDTSLMGPILDALGQRKLSSADRLCLLSDHFALARAGRIPMTTALTLATSFTGETDYSVWCELRTQLNYIRSLIQEVSYISCEKLIFPPPSPPEEGLMDLICHLAEEAFKKLDWKPKSGMESNNDTLVRPLLISMLGASGSEMIINEARSMFSRHYAAITEVDNAEGDRQTDRLIPADLREAVYSTVLRYGGEEEFLRLLTLHDRAQMHDERERILSCLGATRQPELLQRIVPLTMSDFVRKQDRFRPLIGISGTPAGRRSLLNLIKSRIEHLSEELSSSSLMGYVIKYACEGFCSSQYYQDIQGFFIEHPVPCNRSVQQALESIAVNMEVIKRDSDILSQYLIQFKEVF